MSKQDRKAQSGETKPKLSDLEQKVREQRRKVTNQKAAIFDLIEQRTAEMNEMDKHKNQAEVIGRNVLKQQQVLEGERKVLNGMEEEMEKLYPEVTTNKV